MKRFEKRRQRLLDEIRSLNLILDTFDLPDRERARLQHQKQDRIIKLGRLESVRVLDLQDRLTKPE